MYNNNKVAFLAAWSIPEPSTEGQKESMKRFRKKSKDKVCMHCCSFAWWQRVKRSSTDVMYIFAYRSVSIALLTRSGVARLLYFLYFLYLSCQSQPHSFPPGSNARKSSAKMNELIYNYKSVSPTQKILFLHQTSIPMLMFWLKSAMQQKCTDKVVRSLQYVCGALAFTLKTLIMIKPN
jgi:hypothetical protein